MPGRCRACNVNCDDSWVPTAALIWEVVRVLVRKLRVKQRHEGQVETLTRLVGLQKWLPVCLARIVDDSSICSHHCLPFVQAAGAAPLCERTGAVCKADPAQLVQPFQLCIRRFHSLTGYGNCVQTCTC